SGKTWSCAAGLFEACTLAPGSVNPYVALTAKNARFVLWPILHQFNDRHSLGLRMHDHELVAQLDNGAQILLVGADDVRKVEHLRGLKCRRVIIDEAQAYPGALLRYLVEDVLDAALLDLDGDMWLVGTPNAACAGHFHDLITGTNPDVAQIPSHHWTVIDNIHIPHRVEWLARKTHERNWTKDHPAYRREDLGQCA